MTREDWMGCHLDGCFLYLLFFSQAPRLVRRTAWRRDTRTTSRRSGQEKKANSRKEISPSSFYANQIRRKEPRTLSHANTQTDTNKPLLLSKKLISSAILSPLYSKERSKNCIAESKSPPRLISDHRNLRLAVWPFRMSQYHVIDRGISPLTRVDCNYAWDQPFATAKHHMQAANVKRHNLPPFTYATLN